MTKISKKELKEYASYLEDELDKHLVLERIYEDVAMDYAIERAEVCMTEEVEKENSNDWCCEMEFTDEEIENESTPPTKCVECQFQMLMDRSADYLLEKEILYADEDKKLHVNLNDSEDERGEKLEVK